MSRSSSSSSSSRPPANASATRRSSPPAPRKPSSLLTEERHTLLLVQVTSKASSKQYEEYPSVAQAMEGVCSLYESQLPSSDASMRDHGGHALSSSSGGGHTSTSYEYDIGDLYAFVDRLPDLACLVWAESLRAYEPYDKVWVKAQLYEHLLSQQQ